MALIIYKIWLERNFTKRFNRHIFGRFQKLFSRKIVLTNYLSSTPTKPRQLRLSYRYPAGRGRESRCIPALWRGPPAVAPEWSPSRGSAPARCKTCTWLGPDRECCNEGQRDRHHETAPPSGFSCHLSCPPYVLVLVALPENCLHPFQPRLALLRRSGEAQGGHFVGYDGENVSGFVHPSQLLLHFVFTPRVDEGQRLQVRPRNTPSSCDRNKHQTIWLVSVFGTSLWYCTN